MEVRFSRMKKIEAIIRPSKLDDVSSALSEYGIRGMTVTHVMGCGKQKGHTEVFRGTTYNIRLLPKIKIEIVCADDKIDEIIKIISDKAITGAVGDGKIFISTIENAYQIRTGEQGNDAL